MTQNPTPEAEGGNKQNFLSRIFSKTVCVPVTLVSRRDCPLCAEARETLLLLAPSLHIDINEIEVDDDQALEDLYGLEVPVVLVDGARHCFGHVDPVRLKPAVEAARNRRAHGT